MRTYDKIKTYRRGNLGLESPELLEYARYELSRNRQIQLRMSGSSMRPMIDDGDIVTVAPIDPTTINSQDIVLFTTQSGTALIHRVVSLQTREGCLSAITRGDHAQQHDTPVPLARIMGRVVALQRKGKGKIIPVRRTPGWLVRLRLLLARLW
ncbi:MAG: signal peptidase I [Acidobacteria bacterium]|nr:signal peptidase I [Acidobacteriota bacterium]